jgi:hypothetical protein
MKAYRAQYLKNRICIADENSRKITAFGKNLSLYSHFGLVEIQSPTLVPKWLNYMKFGKVLETSMSNELQ